MAIQSPRHRAVLEQLTEWWESLRDRGTGPQVVLVPVPRRWGRSRVLEEFKGIVEDHDGPLTFSVSCAPLAGRAIQAQGRRAIQAEELSEALRTAELGSRAARLFGLDTVAGKAQLGLGIVGPFASGLAATVPLLLTSLAVTAAGNAWDSSPSGQQSAVARAARAVAAVSVQAPVLVTVDDAELLDLGLAVTMIENLAGRYDGQVLVVATITPKSDLEAKLFSPGRYELLGRIHKADADPDMSYGARAALVREVGPDLPDVAIERIARRTRNFVEVFAVCAADRLADLIQETGDALLADVDTVINASLEPAKVSTEATVLAWAGGALYIRQADRVLEVLGTDQQQDDPWVIRSGGLARLTGPASPGLTEQFDGKHDARTRRQLATVVLDEADSVARDPDATLVERVIARQAAHHIRDDLDASSKLTRVQCALIRDLEKLDDPVAAYEVAKAARASLPADDQGGEDRREILTAMLRLARTRPRQGEDPLIEEAIALAATGGAVLGLEARVWAAVDLLDRPGRREAACKLTDQVTAELANHPVTETTANHWRLLLAFHAGRAGYPDTSQRLLTPMINKGTTEQQETAQKILRTIGGRQADTRLQIIILEAELAARPQGADDDLLRLHSALAADYYTLGDYRSALQHGGDELALRQCLQGPDHWQTLTARAWVARWTGHCGNSAEALRIGQELLPDQVRVLGPDHPAILLTRSDIAAWTGECGNGAEALRLLQELLPEQVRALGPDHPATLLTRGNIALWTGHCGNNAEALRIGQELLPNQVPVLGPDDIDTLTMRGNIARWTGLLGNYAEARRMLQELLPDQVRALGPDHPATLLTRANIAAWTGQCGNGAEALRMYQELLPDQVRALGPDHPDTLTIRANIADGTGRLGNHAEELRMLQKLLPDQVRVLGPDHPDTLNIRRVIAHLTGEAGNPLRAQKARNSRSGSASASGYRYPARLTGPSAAGCPPPQPGAPGPDHGIEPGA